MDRFPLVVRQKGKAMVLVKGSGTIRTSRNIKGRRACRVSAGEDSRADDPPGSTEHVDVRPLPPDASEEYVTAIRSRTGS